MNKECPLCKGKVNFEIKQVAVSHGPPMSFSRFCYQVCENAISRGRKGCIILDESKVFKEPTHNNDPEIKETSEFLEMAKDILEGLF